MAGWTLAAEKINVLIIDGQNNHNWKATTPVLKEMLLKSERFNVDVVTTPPKAPPKPSEEAAADIKAAWEKFRPDPSKYGVVLMNYTGDAWPKEVNDAFEKYVQAGGGLVFYHAAVFSMPGWGEWDKMMAMGWHDAKFGDRVHLDDEGKLVRVPKGEGPGGGHGPAQPFEVTIRVKDHPITKGLPEKWQHVKDELYHGMRGPAENMAILATAFSDKTKGGTGCHEPMAWTVSYGKGRVYVCLLGHDAKVLEAPDCQALIPRGCEWAATGEVTLPAPEGLSAAPR
jgi:type 1 glutamine amidotransferase